MVARHVWGPVYVNRIAVRAAIHVAAVFALYLSAAMLVPAAVDLYSGHEDWRVFAFSGLFMGGLALGVAMATHGPPPPVTTRFGFFLVTLLWVTMGIVGAVPFAFSSLGMSIADSLFESVSGITTTGSTVISGLDNLPPGLLLWRSLLQWFGGLGVIALGLFILPFLNIGGFSYFKIESSDIDDRPFERFSTFAVSFIAIYVALTLACAIAYDAAGMTWFDAVNHAMTTLATGGYSTHDLSIGFFNDKPAVLWISTLFMFIGGLPFSILILFVARGRLDALWDPQIRVFAGYSIVFIVAVAIHVRVSTDMPFLEALTHAAVNFISLITTCGYASLDYQLWGPFVIACAFVATFLGACSGSTAGGIKAYRFLIMFELLANGLRKLVYPNTILPVRYGDRVVDADVQRGVVLFISSFFVIWAIGTIVISATGLDLVSSMTAVVTAMTNVGPGLGDIVGPAGNFSTIPEAAKWLLPIWMLLGRLEILAVLVIFTPTFWAR
jgi:trk system potassium uptake protein TrkH